MRIQSTVLFTIAALALQAADVANMSGTWALNAKRSRWGDTPQPAGVVLRIEHNEPKFKYSGDINRPGEQGTISFAFDGAIDGKEYPVKEDRIERKVVFKRLNDRSVESRSMLPDGRTEERTVTTLSGDGKTLERRMELRVPGARDRTWTEIYEKKQ